MLHKVIKSHEVYGIIINGVFTPFANQSYDFEHIDMIDSNYIMISPVEFEYGMLVKMGDNIVTWSAENAMKCDELDIMPQPVYQTITITSEKYKKKINDTNCAGKISTSISLNFRTFEIAAAMVALFILPFMFQYPLMNFLMSTICGLLYVLVRSGDTDNFKMNKYSNIRLYAVWVSYFMIVYLMHLPSAAAWQIMISIYGITKIYFKYRNYKDEYAILYKGLKHKNIV